MFHETKFLVLTPEFRGFNPNKCVKDRYPLPPAESESLTNNLETVRDRM